MGTRTQAGVVTFFCFAGSMVETAPMAPHHVEAALLSEPATLKPGTPFWVGLHLRMSPGWHTYWKNAGDAGLPTRLKWTLPEGFDAGPIEWPYPERFSQGPVASYGYSGEVLLLTRISPPASLPAGSEVPLTVRADWLECQEACLPGRAELSTTLRVHTAAPLADPARAELFRTARRRLPAEPTGWDAVLRDADSGVSLVLSPARPASDVKSAYFFPERPGLVDHGAPQRFVRQENGFRLDLTLDANAPKPLDDVSGVLVTDGTAGAQAWRLVARRAN